MDQLTYTTKLVPLFLKSLQSTQKIKQNSFNLDFRSDFLKIKNLFYLFNKVFISDGLSHKKWVDLMRRSFNGVSLRKGFT